MSNALALTLVALVGGALLLDALVLDSGLPLLLARKGLRLIEWVAFWR